jgi:hypothetical protein
LPKSQAQVPSKIGVVAIQNYSGRFSENRTLSRVKHDLRRVSTFFCLFLTFSGRDPDKSTLPSAWHATLAAVGLAARSE